MSQPDFTVEHLDPKTLTANPLNWRRHPEPQRKALAYSLKRFNFVQGVIWNETTKRLVDGHARVEEAIRQGRKTVPVNVVRLSEEDERALLRVFDPIGAMVEPDEETLDRLIAEIGAPDLERLLAAVEVPDFSPVGEDEQGRLDEKAQVTCPDCGRMFAP